MALNVGINGFGRIGRIIFRSCHENPGLKVSAINDPADIDYICYLIKFDSTHGKFCGVVERTENGILVDGQKIAVFKEKLPTNIPWHSADVQYVIEASGLFTNLEKASGHLTSDGVKRVIVTALSLDIPMVILGVNDKQLSFGHKVISCASSTLYCLAPIINVLEENFGIAEGFITSIHAMTSSLKPLDGLCLKGKHWRDHRSIHQNIIPASTGAFKALGKIIPQVKDKMTGLTFRVPIVNVSVLDITIRLKTNTTMEEIIRQVEKADRIGRNGVIKVSNEQCVSSDFVGDTYSCILDIASSLQLKQDFFKLICWYENEYSYARRVIDSIFFLENQYQLEWKTKMAYMRPTPKSSFVQQSELHKKIAYYHACSNNSGSQHKSLCSASQDSGIKSLQSTTFANKPISCRNFEGKQAPLAIRMPKKKNELFKIWNDNDDKIRTTLRHNRNSFFHSCVAITPEIKENTYIKTQERLVDVKKECSKMISITENLLKKSCHSKENELYKNDEAGDTNIKDGVCSEITKISSNNSNDTVSNKDHVISKIQDKENNKMDNNEEVTKATIKRKLNINLINTAENSLSPRLIKNNGNEFSTSYLNNNEEQNNNDQIKNISRISQKPTTLKYCNNLPKTSQTEETINSGNKNDNIEYTDVSKTVQVKSGSCNNDLIINKQRMGNEKEKLQIERPKKPVINTYTQKDDNHFNSITDPPTLVENVCNKDISQDVDSNMDKSTSTEPSHVYGCKNRNLQKRLEGILSKLAIEAPIISEKPSTCMSTDHTGTTVSKRDAKEKEDIFDKLDSVSATDSENSFHMNERKSQVITVSDLTNSLEDLERLDKICRIIEISDELSDQLLSALNSHDSKEIRNKKWSFKDLCERIKLDDFCNKIFSK